MPVNKWVIRTATGELQYGGYYEPTLPSVDAAAFSIVTLPSPDWDDTMPDRRTQRWNGSAVVAKAQSAIDDHDRAASDANAHAFFDQMEDFVDALLTELPGAAAATPQQRNTYKNRMRARFVTARRAKPANP